MIRHRTEHAWGINLGLTDFDAMLLKTSKSKFEGHGLLGGDGDEPFFLCGRRRLKLVSTRSEAREIVKSLKNSWPRAKAVKLTIKIECMI